MNLGEVITRIITFLSLTNWGDVITRTIAVVALLVSIYNLRINIRDRKEFCKIQVFEGLGDYQTIDNDNGSLVTTTVPGYQIIIINPGMQPIHIQSVFLYAEEWEEPVQILFHSRMVSNGHVWSGGKSFLLEPRRNVKSFVSNRKLLEKIEEQQRALSTLHIWIEVTLESGKVFHTKPLAVSKVQLEQARAEIAQLPTRF